jgi:hypothetical protein
MKKGEVPVRGEVYFFEIDSHVPPADPRFAYLKPRGSKTVNGVHGHVLKKASRLA